MPAHSDTLGRRFFLRDPVTLAKVLLGRVLTRVLDDGAVLSGRVVEVEAYLGIPDRAAHTFGGRKTPRNRSMWLDGGHAYVYFTYGMHHCMNVVSDREGTPTACLIRALEPLEGLDRMRHHRARARGRSTACVTPTSVPVRRSSRRLWQSTGRSTGSTWCPTGGSSCTAAGWWGPIASWPHRASVSAMRGYGRKSCCGSAWPTAHI